jgi:hypothetical protein
MLLPKFATKISPPALVEVAEAHAQLARLVNRKYLWQLLRIQEQTLAEAQKEARRLGSRQFIAQCLLKEAVEQRDNANPNSLGQAGALRAAKQRLKLDSLHVALNHQSRLATEPR